MKTEPQDSRSAVTDEQVMEVARMAFQHARSGNAVALAAILDAGLPPNLCNERGDTLLMLASYHGHADATRVLLEHKADPERTNDRGQTPLAGCAFKGDVAMARLLLEHGTRVDGAGPDGKTALMFAAMFDRVEVMEELLSRGAAPGRTDAEKRTAPWEPSALWNGSRRCRRWLDHLSISLPLAHPGPPRLPGRGSPAYRPRAGRACPGGAGSSGSSRRAPSRRRARAAVR